MKLASLTALENALPYSNLPVERGERDDEDFGGEEPTANDLKRADLATYSLLEQLRRDPAAIGFPAMLPVELALRTGTVVDIFGSYGMGKADYDRLKTDPLFLEALAGAKKMAMSREGWGFRMKAALQSEELLKSSWKLIHSADTPPGVKKDLIIATWRAAGVADPEQTEGSRSAFQININLA